MLVKPFGLKGVHKIAQGAMQFVTCLKLGDNYDSTKISQSIADFLLKNAASDSFVVFADGKLGYYRSDKDTLPVETQAINSPMTELALLFDGRKLVEIDADLYLNRSKIKLVGDRTRNDLLEISSNNNNNNNNNNNG